MRIGKPASADMDLRITGFKTGEEVGRPNDQLGILRIEMTWAEWDVLVADAAHLRATGEFRGELP